MRSIVLFWIGFFGYSFGLDFRTANFVVRYNVPDQLQVFHSSSPSRVLWETVAGTPFVTSAIGDDNFQPGNGHFQVFQNNTEFCQRQSILVYQQGSSIVVEGSLSGSINGRCSFNYNMIFQEHSANQLHFETNIYPQANSGYDRIFLVYSSPQDEAIFGLGEQFSFFDCKGEKFPIMTREQGVGRGLQPLTFILNRGGGFVGGDRYTSYIGIPHYITSYQRSLFLENSEFMMVDMTQEDRILFEVASTKVSGRIINGNSPFDLIREYTEYSGRMKPLPDWANKGAIVGMQGGEKKVYEVLEKLESLDTPIGGFWNQDWCGNREQRVGDSIQKRLWWNWEPDRVVYPNWEKLNSNLRAKNIRMMSYINTFLADVTNKTSGYTRNLYKEALELGYFAKNPDGSPLLIESGPGIQAGLIDITNPECFEWIKQIIKVNMIGTGTSGWMADFGEYLPYYALLENGNSAVYKSLYPQEWARLNYEAAAELGLENDIVFFMRAGFSQSPKYTPLFWAGDQLPSWDVFDGIKSTVVSMITSGISGFSLQHSDIGGFSTIFNNAPLPSYVRTKELFFRWCELSAFTATYRTHEGSIPDKNVQFYTDDETYEFFSYGAKLFASLANYRRELMNEASEKGYPIVRHLYLHYPEDKNVLSILYEQFLLGEDLLVAPVLDPEVTSVRVYLPKGIWYHVWSAQTYILDVGTYVNVKAPLREPGVFIREEGLSKPSLRVFMNFVQKVKSN